MLSRRHPYAADVVACRVDRVKGRTLKRQNWSVGYVRIPSSRPSVIFWVGG